MNTKFKTKALVAGVLGSVLSLTAVSSHADLFAYSMLNITDFKILGSDGEPLDAVADFSSLSFTSSADMGGELTGTAGFSYDDPNSLVGIEFPSTCLTTTGDCNPVVNNTFPYISGAQGADYVLADQQQDGSPIDNLNGFNPVAGADVGQMAVGSLSATTAEGTANVNNGLEASWTFSVAQDLGVTFEGDFVTYLEAFAGAGELAPGKASAATTFDITITDLVTGVQVYTFEPTLLNQTTSINANNFPVDITTCGAIAGVTMGCGNGPVAGSFSSTSIALAAGSLYQLSLRSNANIDIARVPVPGTLALLGLGLLGMARRRAKRS